MTIESHESVKKRELVQRQETRGVVPISKIVKALLISKNKNIDQGDCNKLMPIYSTECVIYIFTLMFIPHSDTLFWP
jgi:hypothetical protein